MLGRELKQLLKVTILARHQSRIPLVLFVVVLPDESQTLLDRPLMHVQGTLHTRSLPESLDF